MQPFTIAIPETRLAEIAHKVARLDCDSLPDADGWRSASGRPIYAG